MPRSRTRPFAALAVAGALLALTASPVGAARPVGDTRVFTRVPAPGHPEGLLVRNGVVYVGTHTSMAGNARGGPSRIFRYELGSGKIMARHIEYRHNGKRLFHGDTIL